MTDDFSGGGTGLLDSRPVRWTLVYGLPAVTCLLVGSAIFVARLDVRQDIHIIGQPTWQAGRGAALRILSYDDQGRPQERIQALVKLVGPEGQVEVLGEVGSRVGVPAADLSFVAPRWSDGAYDLQAEVVADGQRQTVVAKVGLRQSAPKAHKLHLPPPPPDRSISTEGRKAVGGVWVELVSSGSGLVPNLSNLVFLRTTDEAGGPTSAEVALRIIGGHTRDPLPETVRTDDLGLAALSVHPMTNQLQIEVSAPNPPAPHAHRSDGEPGIDGQAVDGGQVADAGLASDGGPVADAGPAADAGADADGASSAPRRVSVVLGTVPAQMVMRLDQPAPQVGESNPLRIEALHASRTLYVDAYSQGRWISSTTTRISDHWARGRMPDLPPGVILLQAYTSPVDLGYAYAARHVYLRAEGEAEAAALGAIAEVLRDREIDEAWLEAVLEQGLLARGDVRFERTAAFLLARLDGGHERPNLLLSSRQSQSAELDGFQQSFKVKISLAILVLGLVVAGLLAYLFTVSAYQARKRRLAISSEVGANEQDLYVTSMGLPTGLDRFRIVVQIAVMVGVVAIGFILLAVLVSAMSWAG